MKIGCCIPINKIEEAKALGYDFAELAATEVSAFSEIEWSKIVTTIRNIGLPIQGFNAFCGSDFPIVGPNVNFEALVDYSKIILKRAHDLGCKSIGIGAPLARIVPHAFPIDVADAQMKAFLSTISDLAIPYNICILYEAINPKDCNYGNTDRDVLNMITRINKHNLAIVWDTYHALESGNTMSSIIPSLHCVSHIHICSSIGGSRIAPNLQDKEMYHQLFSILKEYCYAGTISVESPFTDFELESHAVFSMVNM